jgi:hypothetical protein
MAGTITRTAPAGRSSSARDNPRISSNELTEPRRLSGEAFLLYGLLET